MLSRLAFKHAFQLKNSAPSLVGALRLQSTKSEGPERDLVNYPRPVFHENPGKTRYGFVPEEWFEMFYKKTGVTGPYVFGAGLTTYLLSKEIWVQEHNFTYVFGFFAIVYFANKKFGTQIAEFLDKETDKQVESFQEGRKSQLNALEDGIKNEEDSQWRAEGQTLLVEAKRENVKMQLEAAYRERAMMLYQEVKKRLDYQAEKERIDRMISQKAMVQWVVSNVLQSISAQQEKDNIKKCLSDLQALAARA